MFDGIDVVYLIPSQMLHFIAQLMTLRPLLFWDVRRRGLVVTDASRQRIRPILVRWGQEWEELSPHSPRWKPGISRDSDVPLAPFRVPAEHLRRQSGN